MDLRPLLRAPSTRVRLDAVPTRDHPGIRDRASAAHDLRHLREELSALGDRHFAEGTHGSPRRLVLVLQGMDCSGKDGAIRRVLSAVNPEGLRITSFKRPTEEELAHDFLWRIERALPPPGVIGVFNRSHYEDVTVVRVHDLVPPELWRPRYEAINNWEAEQAGKGVVWLKVFLHLSHAEQSRRLLARLDNPAKHWKFEIADLDERDHWADYQRAYEAAFERCSEASPWYLIPADRKWYRDWALATLVTATLRDLDLRWPDPLTDIAGLRRRIETQDLLD